MAADNMIFALQDDPLLAADDPVSDAQTTQMLVFESAGLLFGASVEFVVEIITNHMITHLPMVPEYVSGILNLRGQIIPLIDFRLRLGKPYKEDCLIIVLDVNGTLIGILVDSVAQMVTLPKESILPVPAHNTQKMVSGMCSLPDGSTMLVLDCALLVEG